MNHLSLEEIQENKGDSFHPLHDDDESDDFENKLSNTVLNIYNHIEAIPETKYRTLIKLKLYIKDYVILNNQDLKYIRLHSRKI